MNRGFWGVFPTEIGLLGLRRWESLVFPRFLLTFFIAVAIPKWYKRIFLPEPEGDWRTALAKCRSRWLGLPLDCRESLLWALNSNVTIVDSFLI